MAQRDVQQHALELAEALLEEVEMSATSVSQQVRKAARLARLVGDEEAMIWLRFETSGVPGSELGRAHMTRTRRWTNKEDGRGYWGPVSDAEALIENRRLQLSASQVEAFSGEMIALASREHRSTQAAIAGIIDTQSRIVNRVAGLLHEFVMRTYYELAFSGEQHTLFDRARAEIDSMLAPASGRSLEQVDSIYRRLEEGDREAISQAMNTCRRLIDAFANAVYPARPESVERDGRPIDVGEDKTQNRINEYVAEKVDSTSRRRRIKRSLSDIYDRVSTGVHDDVTIDEARFVFLATYTLLGEILAAGSEAPIASEDDDAM